MIKKIFQCFVLVLFSLSFSAVDLSAEDAVEKSVKPTSKPAVVTKKQDDKTKIKEASVSQKEDADVEEKDADENEDEKPDIYDLSAFQKGDLKILGSAQSYTVQDRDTLHDIARHFKVGFVELRAANQGVDAWAPIPGRVLNIPDHHILPRAVQNGLVINLAEMRIYYFKTPKKLKASFPIGIGREGLETPLGQTSIVRKKAGPTWYPTARMKEENDKLPNAIGPGFANPLGSHALYLGWPTFLIHGTNKPSGIGRAVSSGCIRMRPETIKELFNLVPVGTPVTVVNQPIKIAVDDNGEIFLEVSPSALEIDSLELEGRFKADKDARIEMDKLKALIKNDVMHEVGEQKVDIDWSIVKKASLKKTGLPVSIGHVLEEIEEDNIDVKTQALDEKVERKAPEGSEDKLLEKLKDQKPVQEKEPLSGYNG